MLNQQFYSSETWLGYFPAIALNVDGTVSRRRKNKNNKFTNIILIEIRTNFPSNYYAYYCTIETGSAQSKDNKLEQFKALRITSDS